MQERGQLPEADDPEIADADVLLSAEPTYCWAGKALRDEVMHVHATRSYDAQTIARYFSEDRLVLFKRLIVPYLEAHPDRWVIQDRSVITSCAYQPLDAQNKGETGITLEWVKSLPGNRYELAHPPMLLLLLRLAPEEALRRLGGRGEKVDGHVFETPSFQQQLAARYRDPEVLAPYRDAGTRIVEIDAARPPEEVIRSAIEEIERR